MTDQQHHIDKPEPRWQALLAFLAVGAIYLALPSNLVIGPIWLLPTIIVVLLIPTVVSHRTGKHSLNRVLGIIINGITTLALIESLALLVRALPSHKEAPLRLLFSGGLLWLTNVIVFALWYWRLDGGGPNVRDRRHEFGSRMVRFRGATHHRLLIPHHDRADESAGKKPSRDSELQVALRASVRRHRRAQGGSPMRRSIRLRQVSLGKGDEMSQAL